MNLLFSCPFSNKIFLFESPNSSSLGLKGFYSIESIHSKNDFWIENYMKNTNFMNFEERCRSKMSVEEVVVSIPRFISGESNALGKLRSFCLSKRFHLSLRSPKTRGIRGTPCAVPIFTTKRFSLCELP